MELTVYMNQFDCKGDPMKIRARLDEDAKGILRRTNYNLGTDKGVGNTTHQDAFQKRSGGGAPKLTDQMENALKGDH